MKSSIKKALAFGAFIFGLAISTSHVFCGKNAGVFPFAKWNGEIYFLIGKDRHREGWSDFGGIAEDGEITYQTANREFHEETGNFFEGINATRETFYMENNNQSYRTYLVEIMNNINTERLKAHINGIRRKRGRSVQTEKTDFAWVSLRELVHKIAGMDRWNSELKLQVIRGSLGNGTEPEEEVKVVHMFSALLNYNFISKHFDKSDPAGFKHVVIVARTKGTNVENEKKFLNAFQYEIQREGEQYTYKRGKVVGKVKEVKIDLSKHQELENATPGETYAFTSINDIHVLMSEPQLPITLHITRITDKEGQGKKILVGKIYRRLTGEKIEFLGEVKMETNGWETERGEYFFHHTEDIWNVEGIEKVTIYPKHIFK